MRRSAAEGKRCEPRTEVDEFLVAGLDEKPSEIVRAPGIAGCYGWMECGLEKEFDESRYVLIVGRVLRLEIGDEFLRPDGSLDIARTQPLLMTGGKKGMHFATLSDLNRFEPFSAMFPDKKDPVAHKYEL